LPPLSRENQQVQGRIWSTTSIASQLLGDNGWIEAVFATGREYGDTGAILQWLDTHHYVTSVFCFCPHGTIPIAFFNVPGSVHESQVAELGKIYSKLEHVYKTTRGECCVDSAFGNMDRDYLLKLGQDILGSSAPTCHEQNLEHQLR
jgi:hypothetical protein